MKLFVQLSETQHSKTDSLAFIMGLLQVNTSLYFASYPTHKKKSARPELYWDLEYQKKKKMPQRNRSNNKVWKTSTN